MVFSASVSPHLAAKSLYYGAIQCPSTNSLHLPEIADIARDIKTIQGTVSELHTSQLDAEDQKIVDWLAPSDLCPNYTALKNEHLATRQLGTGKWFLESGKFQKWQDAKGETLFCPGIPGAGKTIMASIVIDHLLRSRQSKDDTSVAYVYFRTIWEDKQSPDKLLGSILQQLVQHQEGVPQSVKDLWVRHKGAQSRPQTEELLEALNSVISLKQRTFIIINALDECQDNNRCRTDFLEAILSLQRETPLNFLATSRPQDVEKMFDGLTRLEISATSSDMDMYVDSHLSGWDTRRCGAMSLELKQRIKSEVTKAADGMYV